jgi:hypothetical protein
MKQSVNNTFYRRKVFFPGIRNITIFIPMKSIVQISILAAGFLISSVPAFPQCEVRNRVSPDGSMMFFMEPVNFYWTSAKSLKGCIVTDKENYFLELSPLPFPPKPEGRKLKGDLQMTLSDGKLYALKHFDTRYIEDDTVMEILYLINREDQDNMLNLEVVEVKIDMNDNEGPRSYVFKLHKSALKEQLACFLKEEESKKKK